MPEFVYEALDPKSGKRLKEAGEFDSVLELFQWLRRRGLVLIKYKERRYPFWGKFLAPRVSRRELAEFCRNLAFMIRGGVPLLQALEDLAKATDNKSLAEAIKKLHRAIESGRSFSEGMLLSDKIFSPIVRALTLVGEETGRLDETLEAAAEHLLRVEEIISNTKRALIYPVFLLVTMSLAMGFWIFFVLPKILTLFKQMGVSLPLATRMLMVVVDFCTANWILFLLPPVCFLLLFALITKNEKAKFMWEKLLFKTPFFRTIKRLSALSFFFEYTALLLQSGVNLLNSLEIMQKSIRSPYLFKVIEHLKKSIEEGYSFTQACETSKFFSHLELRMISVGEETGRLVDQLRYLADYYYKRLEVFVATLSKVIEPALIIIAGLMFLIIALALIGPIYDMIGQIGATG